MTIKVLVVDDEPSSRQLCVEVLKGLGYESEAVDSPAKAIPILEEGQVDIVLSDVRMPGGSGIDLLRLIKESHPSIDVLMMTGFATIPEAVEAVKLGAYDYIAKPFQLEKFRTVVNRLVERQRMAEENRLLREELKTQRGFGEFVGTSAAMQQVYQLILKVSGKRHPVLILGESGTGKELVARAIHAFGPLKAFTGATQSRTGLLAVAEGGTVLLDEIGELPVELQAKLLRALQEREIRPLGSNEPVPLRARVLAATNRDLEAAVGKGTFRQDLYFRLNVVSLLIPPLRERKTDIPALAQYFVDRHADPADGITGFGPEAIDRMMSHSWPGNVRELENCVQRALALGSGPLLQLKDLPPVMLGAIKSQAEPGEPHTLEDLERRAILNALETAGGDRLRAAKLLGIGKTTIYRKLKEYGIDENELADLPDR
jgi:DNA-binding NtrC family response regulator